jgi:hypothetical protein
MQRSLPPKNVPLPIPLRTWFWLRVRLVFPASGPSASGSHIGASSGRRMQGTGTANASHWARQRGKTTAFLARSPVRCDQGFICRIRLDARLRRDTMETESPEAQGGQHSRGRCEGQNLPRVVKRRSIVSAFQSATAPWALRIVRHRLRGSVKTPVRRTLS